MEPYAMVILLLGDILGRDVFYIKYHSVFRTVNGTNLLKGTDDMAAVVVDARSEEINVQGRTGCKLLMRIHQGTSLEKEVFARACLRESIENTFLKISGQNRLVEYALLLGYIQQLASDRLSVVLRLLTHSAISR